MGGSDVSIGAIQRILGHENRKTPEIYLHSISEMDQEAITSYKRERKFSHRFSHKRKWPFL